jgi:hypothetical protein
MRLPLIGCKKPEEMGRKLLLYAVMIKKIHLQAKIKLY